MLRRIIITKPIVQRRAELDDSYNKVAESKKKALDKKKRKSNKKEVKDELADAFDDDAFAMPEEESFIGDIEERPKKKKKRKKSEPKEAVTLDVDSSKDDWGMEVYKKPETNITKLSKVKGKKLRSILATNREELLQLVESDDIDTASAAIYKRMLQALVDVIGHTEAMIHKSKGRYGTHQMNLLIGSIRDILLDLQQAQDRGMLADNLCTRYLAPSYLAIGMEILRENETLFNRMKRELDRDSVDRYSAIFADQEQRLGTFVQGQYSSVREEVKKFLQR